MSLYMKPVQFIQQTQKNSQAKFIFPNAKSTQEGITEKNMRSS